MIGILPTLIICVASVLMAFNVYSYLRFSKHVREHGNWSQEQRVLRVPIILLVLFLIGYLIVAFFGNPDYVMAGILFGGSIFVLVMLMLMQRMFDRIRENERLEAKLAAAEEASKAKTHFLSNMSHDIRTPLNAIIGYTTLANGDEVTPKEMKGYIGKIDKASHQLLNIVDDVLEMSRIENGKRDMLRAVLEGICYHLRWLLECVMRKVKTSDTIRFVGGGALSPVTCQMLADITGRRIETVNNTQEVGAIGTALVVAAGVRGTDVLALARQLVKADRVYVPDPANKEIYERNYSVFKGLYRANARSFRALNA